MGGYRDMEHEGWVTRAGQYRYLFGTITSQATEPLLDALGNLGQAEFLDVACGTGDLAAAAARRGARAQGIDFAGTMVANAREKYPLVEFREGDAEELPYAAASFDAATCAFGLPYFADPERALRSVRGVLRRGGKFALTTWVGPRQGGEFFAFVERFIGDCEAPDPGLPASPAMFRLGQADACRDCLASAGFAVERIETIDLVWSTFSPRSIPEMIDASMIRASRLLRAQPPEIREGIARAMDSAGEKMRQGGKIAFRFPALLVVASAR